MQLHDSGEDVVLAFPTPIFRRVWPDTGGFNARLKEIVLARKEADPSTSRSNVGGWQSGHDLITWPHPEMRQLGEMIHEAFGAVMEKDLGHRRFTCRLAVTAWANVNGHGHYNRHHTHANNHWSGVYYVTLGEPDPEISPNGAIEFTDPRPAVGVFELGPGTSVSTWTLQPGAGQMLLFPSWLRHGVLPFYGAGERVSIAFNLRARDFQLS